MTSNKFVFLLLLLFAQNWFLEAQNIPASRITNWNTPGCSGIFNFKKVINLSSYGADTNGKIACDNALQFAINALKGSGEIYISKGKYLFLKTINLPDSIILQGEVNAQTSKSMVFFKLSAGDGNPGISIAGTETNSKYKINYSLVKGKQKLYVSQPQLFSKGDYIRLNANDDSLLLVNNGPYHLTGQIFQITQIIGDSLVLNKPIRRSYASNNFPEIYKLTPRKQVHIKCINIERIDSTALQTSNIYFYCAAECSVSGVGSSFCNFAHIDIRSSTKISVENSFFTNAFSYGSDGKGYGIMLANTTGDCYIHQNNFDHLRHSMILQSGSNGNVLAYNCSVNPFWTGTQLPSSAAGDLVLHGNYVYMNLMEGNMVQNIVIDNSHGFNGPFNTFFRNRAELYGIYMNDFPASNQQNFIGNQVSGSLGYSLKGTDNFEYGNMVYGTVKPSGTKEPTDSTMFGYHFNSFYHKITTVPPIKNSNWKLTTPLIEAEYRSRTSFKNSICAEIIYEKPVGINQGQQDNGAFEIYPNPCSSELNIRNITGKTKYSLSIYNNMGLLVYSANLEGDFNSIDTKWLNAGLYFLVFEADGKYVRKLMKN